ncbi:MAG: FeoB-associated Cys-rich membrane protein [Halanaerobiales bacterium]
MANIIVSIIILAIVAVAIAKIVIEKRKGVKCIGCPYSKGDSGCSCED